MVCDIPKYLAVDMFYLSFLALQITLAFSLKWKKMYMVI